MSSKSKKAAIILGVLAIVGSVVFVKVKKNSNISGAGSPLSGKSAIVYRSSTCGCCANYIKYLRQAGVTVQEKLTSDMGAIKRELGIPRELESCHTTVIDNYKVEGHIPLEAIEKLVSEKPAMAGIGMPGMPSGSPGMPGAKYGLFEISSFGADGSVAEFVSL